MILQIVAAAAQRVPVNYTSKDGLFAKQMYEELMSSIRFLVPSGSSSTWKHEFMRVLRHSHSIRIHPIQQENKTMVRGEHADRCALCGRAEATCMQLVELAGNANGKEHMGYDAREWSDLERLDEVYENLRWCTRLYKPEVSNGHHIQCYPRSLRSPSTRRLNPGFQGNPTLYGYFFPTYSRNCLV